MDKDTVEGFFWITAALGVLLLPVLFLVLIWWASDYILILKLIGTDVVVIVFCVIIASALEKDQYRW